MSTHTNDLFPGARSAARLAFAAAVEFGDEPERVVVDGVRYVVGKPIHIFPRGTWAAVDGRQVEFNEDDANAMIEDLKSRHSDVALTFDHETDKARGSEAGGWMPVSAFRFRNDGLWNIRPLWVEVVYETLLKTGKFRYLSGDALGVGSANHGDAFHPRRLLAASLVPKPGFVRGLKGIQLAADVKAAIEAWITPKENRMADEAKFASAPPFPPKGDAPPPTDEHEAADCPDPETCEKHKQFCNDTGGKKMSADTNTPVAGEDKLVAEKFAALGTKIAEDTLAAVEKRHVENQKAAIEAAEKAVEARFAAQKQRDESEAKIAAAIKEGRLTPAMEPLAREMFGVSAEKGMAFLEAMPKPAVAPQEPLSAKNAFVTGNGSAPTSREEIAQMFDNPDRNPEKYAAQSKFLTQVARFAANEGVELEMAFAAVLKGDNAKLEDEIYRAGDMTAEKFSGAHVGQFRASQRQIPVDPAMVDFIKNRVRKGDIPDVLVPQEIQKFATLSDFQPAARTTLPMALGYYQSDFIGDEALPVFIGGADERAAWPEFAFEKFAAVAQAAGLLSAPTRTSLNVTWHTVTLEKYPVQVDIDRRARAASVTLPRGIDTIALENIKSQVATTKELAQATFLQTNGSYYDATYYPSVTAWSSAGTPAAYVGEPIKDITTGMAHLRAANRAWPDVLILSPNAALALRKNQQIIDAVRYTGTMERPGTMVPNSTLAAIFNGLLNLTIVVGEAGYSSLPSGAGVADIWGNDAWLVCTGKGKIEAPRFGMTVAAAGSPRVRSFPQEGLGADGADSIVYTDSWSVVAVSSKAAYWMKGASAAL